MDPPSCTNQYVRVNGDNVNWSGQLITAQVWPDVPSLVNEFWDGWNTVLPSELLGVCLFSGSYVPVSCWFQWGYMSYWTWWIFQPGFVSLLEGTHPWESWEEVEWKDYVRYVRYKSVMILVCFDVLWDSWRYNMEAWTCKSIGFTSVMFQRNK